MASEYQKAGVNIQNGNAAVNDIKSLAKATQGPSVLSGIGGFGAEYDLASSLKKFKHPVLVSGTDGVGTKLLLAIKGDLHTTVGIDLVAMSANDILAQGADPLFFLDYIAVGKLKPQQIKKIVKGVADGCQQAHLALIGGEMAEMPGLYNHRDYDLSGFAVGIGDRDGLLGVQNVQERDDLIGLASTGIHSNGYSLVRKVIRDAHLDLNRTYPGFKQSLLKTLLTPTELYYNSVMPLINHHWIHAIANITGGGIAGNLCRVIPTGLTAQISRNAWQVPQIFRFLQKEGNLAQSDLDEVFNQGIGMILVVPHEKVDAVKEALTAKQQRFYELGKVVKRHEHAVEVK